MNLSFGQKSELSSHQISVHGSSYEGDHSFKSNGEIAVFPLGMAIQDLAIFTMLDVFVVLPSFTLSHSYYVVMAVFTAVLFGCIAPVVCSIDYATDSNSTFNSKSSLCPTRTASWRTTGADGRVFPTAVEYVVEVSFMYLLRVLVYILMVREWSLIYNPCARVSFQVLK